MRVGIPIVLTVLLAVRQIDAQPTERAAECAIAVKDAEGRALPSMSDWDAMRWYGLSMCGATGVRAAAAALRTRVVRREFDNSKLADFFIRFGGSRSEAMIASLLDAAEDTAAANLLRLWAIDALSQNLSPHSSYNVDMRGFFISSVGRGCALTVRIGKMHGPAADTLPANFFDRFLASMTRITATSASAPQVQTLARCWKEDAEYQAPIDTAKVKVTYICGNDFKIHNGNTADLDLIVTVLGTNESREWTVLPGEDFTYSTENKGSFQISFKGKVLATVPNGNKVCP